MITIEVAGQQLNFPEHHGINNNVADNKAFDALAGSLHELGSGLTAGTGGTNHPYTDYRATPDYVVRQARRGYDGARGYLQLIPFSEADEAERSG